MEVSAVVLSKTPAGSVASTLKLKSSVVNAVSPAKIEALSVVNLLQPICKFVNSDALEEKSGVGSHLS